MFVIAQKVHPRSLVNEALSPIFCPRKLEEHLCITKKIYGGLTCLEKLCWEAIRAIQRLLKYLLSTEELSIRQERDCDGNQLFYGRGNTTGRYAEN